MNLKLLVIFLIALIFPDICISATEYTTFRSFYVESSNIYWIFAILAALIAAATVILTGGTATPLVTSIATWIGGLSNLSGVAATNFGFALLGGGSIASGGFGVLGGKVLLSSVLAFQTSLIPDYTIGKIETEFNYAYLLENSKEMILLPMPINESGPDVYVISVRHLRNLDLNLPLTAPPNEKIIRDAIKYIHGTTFHGSSSEISKISAKVHSLLALLYFSINDFMTARSHAREAINLAKDEGITATLPAFIYATSILYEEKFDLDQMLYYFGFSINAEPDNPLIPLLSSIFLDRMMLRFNDGYLDESAFAKTFNIYKAYYQETSTRSRAEKWLYSYDKITKMNYIALLARYFIRLKLEQQKITSLSETVNETIKSNPITLQHLRRSLVTYSALINGAVDVYNNLLGLDSKTKEEALTINFMDLLIQYRDDTKRLKALVDDLQKYQDIVNQNVQTSYVPAYNLVILIVVIVFLVAFLVVAKKRRSL